MQRIPNLPPALICAPITETNAAAFLHAAAAAAPIADIIELRLDYLPDDEACQTVLAQLPAFADQHNTPLLLTLRPREQGGMRDLTLAQRQTFWHSLPRALAEQIALVDFEFDLVASLAALAAPPPLPWEKVICSWHNFDETPAQLAAQFAQMSATPAAIIKVATKCQRIADCLPLFELMQRSAKPFIVLGMGLAGIATRVLALSHGAVLTFGALRRGAESASGQPTVDELRQQFRATELTPSSEIYGVIGNPVGHSRSPRMHNAALRAHGRNGVYLPFEVDDARAFIRDFVHPRSKKLNWNLRGLSVTIPHKLAVMPALDALDATAQAVGAVNTIVVAGEQLIGYNTDVTGAMQPLAERIELHNARVAVLGAGGAARAVCYGLQQRGAQTTIYARDLSKAAPLAEEFGAQLALLAEFNGAADIVINTTPMGMHGHSVNESPVNAASLRGVKLVFDLVYNPEQTVLLQQAQAVGCQTLGGLAMLIAQAAEQFRLWTGEPDATAALQLGLTNS